LENGETVRLTDISGQYSLYTACAACLRGRQWHTATTAWRWRKKCWLKTTNIAGRVYIYPKDLREFNRRAEAGEFAKEHIAPKRKKAEPDEESSLNE